MDLMPRDILWLGLHKTGTTFLQKSLDRSQQALRAAGVGWVGLESFRSAWTRPLLHAGHPEPPAPAETFPACPRRLVFDENILALVQDVVTPAGLYPQGAERARIVARHLGLRAPLLVLGLRGFAGFLPSLYCETLKSTPFRPFRTFLRWPPEAMSWLPLVERLCAAFPESPMLLYRAEDLPGREAQLLAEVTGLAPATFTLHEGIERPGFSQAALDAIAAQAEAGPVGPDQVKATAAALPRGAGRPGFDPWDARERGLLQAIEARDLAALRHRTAAPGAGVRLFTP